jgi:hypothetical protein
LEKNNFGVRAGKETHAEKEGKEHACKKKHARCAGRET